MKFVNPVLLRLLVVGGCLLGATAGSGPAVATEPPRDLHLFLLAGQSNMAGRGEIDPADNAPLDRVWIWGPGDHWRPAVEPYHHDKDVAGAGLARSFAERYLAEHPGVQIGFIPAACGGSALEDWAVGAHFRGTQSDPWADAMRRARLALGDGVLRGILWHQGESDSHPGRAERYEAALGELLQRFRQALAAKTVPIVLGQTGRFEGGELTAAKRLVDAANRTVADRLPGVAYVTAEGLKSKPDGIHFDTASLRELGRRYYVAWRLLAGAGE